MCQGYFSIQDLDKRVKNRILRFEFITYILAKYKLEQCKGGEDFS